MNATTERYKGYTITIAQDESPENPFESWDCEPPLMAYYGGRHGNFSTYQGAPENIREAVMLLPASVWQRGNRVPLIREHLNCTLKEFAECSRNEYGDTRDTFATLLSEQVGNKPSGWRDALAWFESVSALLTLAGIPHYYGQSNGYSQGDSTLVLAMATPEWVAKVGAPADSLTAQCKSAFDLYSAWAWGDVYGLQSIHAPGPQDEEGEELKDASVWGFYGSDHEQSGLMEHARAIIDSHIAERAEETATLEAALFCNA